MGGSDAHNNVQAKPIVGQRRAVPRLHARLHEVMLGGWPASRGLFSNFATGVISIFAIEASIIDNGPVAALERLLPLLDFQRLSTAFNAGATTDMETR
jgi:hypothetical protein